MRRAQQGVKSNFLGLLLSRGRLPQIRRLNAKDEAPFPVLRPSDRKKYAILFYPSAGCGALKRNVVFSWRGYDDMALGQLVDQRDQQVTRQGVSLRIQHPNLIVRVIQLISRDGATAILVETMRKAVARKNHHDLELESKSRIMVESERIQVAQIPRCPPIKYRREAVMYVFSCSCSSQLVFVFLG